MPRPGDYTPARRRTMQLVLGGVLLATIALAAIASRLANRSGKLELSPQTITRGNVTVRLPLRWRAPAKADDDPRIVAQARESTDEERGRSVRVMLDRIDTPASPLQYLRDAFGVLDENDEFIVRDLTEDGSMGESTIELTQIGGVDAVMVGVQRVHQRGGTDYALHKDVYACAVLPSMEVITVQLHGTGPIDEFLDHATVAQIAAGVTIAGAPRMEPAEKLLALPSGIELRPPTGFGAIEQNDPNRTDRLFWRAATSHFQSAEQLESAWTSIEVVGCLFPQLDANDPTRNARATAVMQTILLTRDSSWRGATVSLDEKTGTWRAVRTPAGGDAGAAYLFPEPGGRALLAVFRGGADGSDAAGRFEHLWSEMQPSVRFRPMAEIAQLEDAGAAEAARIAKQPLDKLLGERDEQWWLDSNDTDRPYVGWSSLEWQRGGKARGELAADVESRDRNFAGDISRIVGTFQMRSDGRQYSCTLTGEGRDEPFTQKTTFQRGQLSLSFGVGKQEAVTLSRAVPPAQFIPGALLPLIMDKLEQTPMLLRTESFIDCPAPGAPALMTVVLRPASDGKRMEKIDDKERPMRSVIAEVNGSGRLSRWYFNSAGELECVELPGGVQRTSSSLAEVRTNFGKNSEMAP